MSSRNSPTKIPKLKMNLRSKNSLQIKIPKPGVRPISTVILRQLKNKIQIIMHPNSRKKITKKKNNSPLIRTKNKNTRTNNTRMKNKLNTDNKNTKNSKNTTRTTSNHWTTTTTIFKDLSSRDKRKKNRIKNTIKAKTNLNLTI